MKFKLDENLGLAIARVPREVGNAGGRLWITEFGRIRIHQAAEPND